jgi:DNA modification methylase
LSKEPKRGTRTGSFGSSKRETHDSSIFYARKLYGSHVVDEKLEESANPIPLSALDRVLCQDSSDMKQVLPDSSVHLMVTSPPYNVGKEYDENLDIDSYLRMLQAVFEETHRVLVPGGRVCVNIANVGRKPYIPYHKFVIDAMLRARFLMRGEIIWDKGAGAGSSTAWGSWRSASNPILRDVHEYILVFSKAKFSRRASESDEDARTKGNKRMKKKKKRSTISRDEFLEYSKSVWRFNPESAWKVGHPAPFPIELPLRCIKFYTFEGDVVLDPFCGVGTTCIAALMTKRHFVGLEINSDYVARANTRIAEFLAAKKK